MMKGLVSLTVAPFALAGAAIVLAFAAAAVVVLACEDPLPCPAQGPLKPAASAPHAGHTVDSDNTTNSSGEFTDGDSYTFVSEPLAKAQADRDDTAEQGDPGAKKGRALACTEWWREIDDPCTGEGAHTCTWTVKWQLHVSAALLNASADNTGSGYGQGYAHIKIWDEDHSQNTVLSVNAYSTGDPQSQDKSSQSLTGPWNTKQKGIGQHLSGYVEVFAKFDNQGTSKGSANADANSPGFNVQWLQVTGTCGCQASSGGG